MQSADDFEDALDNIVHALEDGTEVPPFLDLSNAFENFVNDTQKDPSADVRKPAAVAAGEVKPKLDNFIKKAQDAAQHPNDKQKLAA